MRPEGVEGKSWPIECGSAKGAACKFVEFYEIRRGTLVPEYFVVSNYSNRIQEIH